MKLTIYGASDDLVEVMADGRVIEEFDAHGPWRGRVEAPDGKALYVTAEFCKPKWEHEWTLGVENTVYYPAWPIVYGERPDRDGDPAIILEVPDGTRVREAVE